MCFNYEVSIGTFIFSWSSAIYLLTQKKLTTKQYQDVIFLMIFSSMQGADAILWLNKMKKNNINYIVTSYVIPLILSAQIIYNLFVRAPQSPNSLKLVSILLCIYAFVRFNGYSKSACNNYFSSPIWGSQEIEYWEFCIFILLFVYPNVNFFFIGAIIVIPIIQYIFNGGYGSMFCAVANGGALWYLYKY